MDTYEMELGNWASKLENDFGNYAPYKFDRDLLTSDVSKDTKYFMASLYRDAVINNMKNGKTEEKKNTKNNSLWLQPFTYGNTVYIIDRFTNEVRDVINKGPYGVNYHGYESDITKFGGRGELHQIGADFDDGKLFSGYGK